MFHHSFMPLRRRVSTSGELDAKVEESFGARGGRHRARAAAPTRDLTCCCCCARAVGRVSSGTNGSPMAPCTDLRNAGNTTGSRILLAMNFSSSDFSGEDFSASRAALAYESALRFSRFCCESSGPRFLPPPPPPPPVEEVPDDFPVPVRSLKLADAFPAYVAELVADFSGDFSADDIGRGTFCDSCVAPSVFFPCSFPKLCVSFSLARFAPFPAFRSRFRSYFDNLRCAEKKAVLGE